MQPFFYDGLAIIDTMNYIEPDVETIGIGLQASMGAMLLSSGAKGKRRRRNMNTITEAEHGETDLHE